MTLRRFGPVPWGNSTLPWAGAAPPHASCHYCPEAIGPLDQCFEVLDVWFHRECLTHALLGPPILEGDPVRASARLFTKTLTIASARGVMSENGFRYYPRDRLRLVKAQAILEDPSASKDNVSSAILSLQSTDDPHPDFHRTHNALQARLKDM